MPGLGLGDFIVNLVKHQGCVLPDYTSQLPLRRVRLELEVDVVTSSGKVGARGGRRRRRKRLQVGVTIALVTLEEVRAIGSSSSGKAGDVAGDGHRCHPHG